MRILGLALSFVVTAMLATLAFNYASARVATNRVPVQESWMSSSEPAAEPVGYQAYGETGSTGR